MHEPGAVTAVHLNEAQFSAQSFEVVMVAEGGPTQAVLSSSLC